MFLTFIEGFIEVELMVTKRDDDRPIDDRPTDDDRVNIEQSASGRWNGRVLQNVRKNQRKKRKAKKSRKSQTNQRKAE